MGVFSTVASRCPQLYCERCLIDEGSEPEKDDHVAGTAVGEPGFKGKADEAPGSLLALAGHPQAILYCTHVCVCAKKAFWKSYGSQLWLCWSE